MGLQAQYVFDTKAATSAINYRLGEKHGLLNPEKPEVPQSSTEAVSQRSHHSDYPVLSKMAFDILSIPSMSPELERAFSQAKKLITGERNRLGGEAVTACEC
jgi:hAT family protein